MEADESDDRTNPQSDNISLNSSSISFSAEEQIIYQRGRREPILEEQIPNSTKEIFLAIKKKSMESPGDIKDSSISSLDDSCRKSRRNLRTLLRTPVKRRLKKSLRKIRRRC